MNYPIRPADLPITSPESDEASERDRAYFEAHPNATSYTRPYIEGEFPARLIPTPGYILMVEVEQHAPGVRTRSPFTLPIIEVSEAA